MYIGRRDKWSETFAAHKFGMCFFFVKYFYWSSNTVNYTLLQAINLHIYTCTRIEVDYRNPTIINDVIYINKPVDSQ